MIIRNIVQDELAKLLREYQLVPIKRDIPKKSETTNQTISLLEEENIPF